MTASEGGGGGGGGSGVCDYGPLGAQTYGAPCGSSLERQPSKEGTDDSWAAPVSPKSPPNGVSTAFRRPGGLYGGASNKQVGLIVATVIVDALAPLMQERATRRRGFDGSSMVLAETMSYFLGGLIVSVVTGGTAGFWRCIRPTRYLAFLPASAAFSTSNFLTYVAVRGLGASQFYLLAQLRVAVLAVFLRIWTGARQPWLAWLALLQLAAGMVVLVHFKANIAVAGCALGSAGGLPESLTAGNFTAMLPSTARGAAKAAVAAAASAQAAAASRAEFAGAILALSGVIVSSAFAFIYMEWQMKLHAQDHLFVQLHQMNSFGAMVSLVIHLGHMTQSSSGAPGDQERGASAALAAGQLLSVNGEELAENATGAALRGLAGAGAAIPISPELQEGSALPQFLMLITVIISRGVLSATVLKNLDSIAKGLIDVTAIVVCTGIQFTMDPNSVDGTVIGIQTLMLLSISSYIVARSSAPSCSVVPQKPCIEMSYHTGGAGSSSAKVEALHSDSDAKKM